MVTVTHAERIVYPEAGHTKGDVVAYYERAAARILPHVAGRPLTMRRYPRGIGQPGFFQKNVPPHYPESIERIEIPRREGVTVHPCIREASHLPYLANQGVIELHVPTVRSPNLSFPDRLVIDLDPPEGRGELARRAALEVREDLEAFGMPTVPVATGSKGYHVVAAIVPSVDIDAISTFMHKLATLLVHRHPDSLTLTFRVARRAGRVFVDFLRNAHAATVVAPYSLRARPLATIAAPLSWDEIERTPPDAFRLANADALLARPDTLATLAEQPVDATAFMTAVEAAFDDAGLAVEIFDRFRA